MPAGMSRVLYSSKVELVRLRLPLLSLLQSGQSMRSPTHIITVFALAYTVVKCYHTFHAFSLRDSGQCARLASVRHNINRRRHLLHLARQYRFALHKYCYAQVLP